jgi:hypothetical protein
MVTAKRRGRPPKTAQVQASADAMQVGGNHYKNMPVQPWEVMESMLTHEEFLGFLKGCMIKYSMRQGLKDAHDAEKFRHYKQKYAEVLKAYKS